jgi:hypothetical protein
MEKEKNDFGNELVELILSKVHFKISENAKVQRNTEI